MKLLLLLSFGGSLRRWHETGILSREIELYVEHLRLGHFRTIDIYSYDPDDGACLSLIDCPDDIRARLRIVTPRRGRGGSLGKLLHSLDVGLLNRLAKDLSVVKTNQISGAWSALILWAMGVPVFVRCGYLLSRRHWKNGNWLQAGIAGLLETALYNAARVISVTTEGAAKTVGRMTFGRRRVFVAPTYVNTELFNADVAAKPRSRTVVFVGRLEPVKNVPNLISACHMAGAPLILVADGSRRSEVSGLIARLSADVQIIPRMQNVDISTLYHQHRLFALPSLHEGLPKALIEAMAAEMICIGTPVPGITDLIQDGVTGYLSADFGPASITAAIERALGDPNSETVGRAARAAVVERHSLRSYVDREFNEMRAAIPGLSVAGG